MAIRSEAMDSLIQVKRNIPITNSILIAQGTNNQHHAVQQLIGKYHKKFERWGKLEFTHLKCGKRGRPSKVYILNEEQALFLMTLLGNNDIVLDFKSELVDQFCRMRKQLQERETPDWKETRELGKKIRRNFTDTIKRYVELAEAQGHVGTAKFAYSNFSKLVKKPFGEREFAGVEQLTLISATEHILDRTLSPLVDAGADAKEIYQRCKERSINVAGLLT